MLQISFKNECSPLPLQNKGLCHVCPGKDTPQRLSRFTLVTPASLIALAQYAIFSVSAEMLTWDKLCFLADALELSVFPAAPNLASLKLDVDGFVFSKRAIAGEKTAEWQLFQALCCASVEMGKAQWQSKDCEDQT